jgi:hypothetical protein
MARNISPFFVSGAEAKKKNVVFDEARTILLLSLFSTRTLFSTSCLGFIYLPTHP